MADRGPDPIASLAQGVFPALQLTLAEFTAPFTVPTPQPVAIAFSGGIDSTVLLHACRTLLGRERLVAFHVHHGLQAAADEFARHSASICADWGVRFELLRLTESPPPGASVEAWAGEQRYRAIATAARAIDAAVTLTAHHEDDQAETVMLRLLRGTGSRGLTGIAPELLREGHRFMRPLLAVPRADIESYAQHQALSWVEDPSNRSQRFTRNVVRQKLMPLLDELAPGAARRIAAAARHFRQADQLMRDYLVADLLSLVQVISRAPRVEVFDCQQARNLTRARVAEALRYWITTLGYEAASEARCQQMLNLVYNLDSPYGEVEHGKLLLIKYRHDLFAIEQGAQMLERIEQVRCEVYAERTAADHAQNNLRPGDQSAADQMIRTPMGRLVLREQASDTRAASGVQVAPALRAAAAEVDRDTLYLPDGRLRIVNFSSGTPPFRPNGQTHEQSLKDCMQAAGVPRWLRPLFPALSVDGKLVWVAGLGANAAFESGGAGASIAADYPRAAAAPKAAVSPNVATTSRVRAEWHWGREKSSLSLPEHLLCDWLLKKSGL